MPLQHGNRLLAALPREDYERLRPHLETVSLTLKQVLHAPNQAIEDVYFPINAVVSLIIIMEDGSSVEVGTVGNEGMVGIPVLLGAESMQGEMFAQIPGEAARMQAGVFKDQINQGGPFRDLLQRYVQALFNQIAQSSACNGIHSTEQRFCKWMLMTRDRVGSDQFPLTQEFIGQMLGVRRATVSEIASKNQRAGLIEYSRGQVRIRDREGLKDCSCECYGITRGEFDRLLNVSHG